MTVIERTATAGEMCSCGRPAVRAFVVDFVVVPYCGIPDDGMMLLVGEPNMGHRDTAAACR